MDINTLFFNTYYKRLENYFYNIQPERLINEEVKKEEFINWVLKPTSISLDDYKPLENKLGEELPLIFKNWHKRHYALDDYIDVRILHLPGSLKENPFEQLNEYLFDHGDSYQDIRNLGLIPFAYDANSRGPLCFDASDKTITPDEYPIVLFEYDTWDKSEIAFTNFEKMLECLINYLETGSTDNFEKIDSNTVNMC